jgi:hypothetical protein
LDNLCCCIFRRDRKSRRRTRRRRERDAYRDEHWLDIDVPMVDGFEDGGRSGAREIIVVDGRRDSKLR